MPKAKSYTGPVDKSISTQLLNSTGEQILVEGEEMLLGDALAQTLSNLEDIVQRANNQLERSDFAKIVAEHLATERGRRGHAEIAVTGSGDVELYVSYKEQPVQRRPVGKGVLPLLEELKVRADRLGADISGFGIKRKKIVDYLDEIENSTLKPKRAKARRKKMPPRTVKDAPEEGLKSVPAPIQVVQTAEDASEEDPGPMSAGPDETRVSAPPDDVKPPKKRGIVKTPDKAESPVVVGAEPTTPEGPRKAPNSPESQGARRGPNMRELVQDSKDLSITDLLQSEPPKQ